MPKRRNAGSRSKARFEKAGANTADTTGCVLGRRAAPPGVGRWRIQCRSGDLRASGRVGLGVVFDDDDDRALSDAQDDHVTVDIVQARLATLVESELYKFSAVADQEKLNIVQMYVRPVCLGMRLEVETALNDVALRPPIDRFVFFARGRG